MATLHILDETGDTTVTYDRTSILELEVAKEKFDTAKSLGYMAFVVAPDKRKTIIHTFDPQAEKIVMTPGIKGG